MDLHVMGLSLCIRRMLKCTKLKYLLSTTILISCNMSFVSPLVQL